MTSLLSHRIKTLTLDADAPFPSEIRDGHAMVLQWRRKQYLHLVRRDRSLDLDRADGVCFGDSADVVD